MQSGVLHSESGPCRRPRCAPWLAAFLFVAGVVALGHPSYQISDDVGILRNLENGFEAPFISMLLGKGLLFLYRIAPPIPWYGLLLYIAHAVSLGLFFSIFMCSSTARRMAVPWVMLYLAIYAGFLLRIGFNAASVMLGINALLAWMSWDVAGEVRRRRTVLGMGCMLAASYLIRVDGFYLVLFLGLPVLLMGAARRGGRRRGVFLFAAPVAVAILLNTLVTPRFVPEPYCRYAEYNLARGRFMDFPIAQANTNNMELMAAVNWSANDYRALTHWFFLDEDVYSRARLQEIVGRSDLARLTPPGYLGHTLEVFWGQYYRHVWLLALALLAAFRISGRRMRGLELAYAVYALAIMIGIALL
ncbi:MAG: hypothetical protein KKC51_10325, partial [Verrucomicrobia bacterium]|nr:hypothetical protein [Verrucomicrobiota bacterium]